MSLSVGAKLGPYEILAPIGAGGMGEVYRARDGRLDRIVAIKVSKTEFTERFAREARAVAAMNHPNICTLHDVGPNYLVMEYVEGAQLMGTSPARSSTQVRDADLRCTQRRAQKEHHAPRPQTGEHSDHKASDQASGFRP